MVRPPLRSLLSLLLILLLGSSIVGSITIISSHEVAADSYKKPNPPPKKINKPKNTHPKAKGVSGFSKKTGPHRKKVTNNLSKSKNKGVSYISRGFNVSAYGGWKIAAHNQGFLKKPRKMYLPIGSKIDRYGHGGGTFASPYRTKFEKRSLPTGSEKLPYTAYIVKKSLPVYSGTVAPAFGKIGLGIQYRFSKSVDSLVKEGYLQPIKKE